MKYWLLAFLISTGSTLAIAAPAPESRVDEAQAGRIIAGDEEAGEAVADGDSGEKKATDATTVSVPESERGKLLKERKLSEAFEHFVPSEAISADNAVPFPADI